MLSRGLSGTPVGDGVLDAVAGAMSLDVQRLVEITRARPYGVHWAGWGEVTQRVTFGIWTHEPGGLRYPRLWDFATDGQTDGTIEITRPWDMGRYAAPMGGMLAASVRDQIAWARFHMGDGTAADGTRVLSEATLRRMQEPTAECPGNALGDAVGISWLMRDQDGLKVVAHGGDTVGQHSIFEMVPERTFAITSLTNCGPNGGEFNEQIMRWAFENYLGADMSDPEPLRLDDDALAPYVGRYETIAVIADISAADGVLMVEVTVRPEVLEQLHEEPDDEPPVPLGILPGDGDRYIVPDGPAKGMKGYFTRGPDGKIDGIHIGGRFATRAG